MRSARLGYFVPLALALVWGASESATVRAQKKGAPPPPPAGSPVLAMPFPMGATRGAALDLTLTGTSLEGPTALLVGFSAKTSLVKDDKADGKSVKAKLEIPADAPVGVYPLRLAANGGVSNLRLFCVDDLPQVLDNDGNREKAKAQVVPVPCVVAGKLEAEQGDFYKVSVTAGQALSFEILGRRLGSPIDPQLTLFHAKTGRELVHDNDAPGCQGDPRIRYTFKEAGDVLIEVRDVLGRGGADYVYRLRIGDFPLATACVPMALKAGAKASVSFAGPHVDGVKPGDVTAPNAPPGTIVWVQPKGAGLAGWPTPLVVSDLDEAVEPASAKEPTKLALPGAVTGRFLRGDQPGQFLVTAKKGQKILLEAHSIEWGSPTPVYLVVRNAKTKAEIAKANPATPPPGDQRLEVTAAEDGELLVEAQHLLYQSGPMEAYRLVARIGAPSFEIALAADKVEASPGGVAILPYSIVRKGYSGTIDLTATGFGEPVQAKVAANQTAGAILVPLKGDRPKGGGLVTVTATATIDGQKVSAVASAKAAVSKALADLVYPSANLTQSVGFAVKDAVPFRIAAKLEPAEASPGTTPSVVVTLTREAGFGEEVAINPLAGLPATVPAPKFGPIAKDKGELKFTLDVNGKTAMGEYFVLLTGKAKVAGRDVVSDQALLVLSVGAPFSLAVEPAKLDLAPGAKAKVKVVATRKAGYKGPIALDLKNVPAKVTGGKGSIAADQTSAEIEIAVAPDAPAAERLDLEVIGSATALNNLQGSAPAIALRVSKK